MKNKITLVIVAIVVAGYLQIGLGQNLDKGLVAYYPFNGNANDESGNGNHGSVSGARLTADRNDEKSSAYKFDGYNDGIFLSNPDAFKLQNFTIAAWVKPNINRGPIIVNNPWLKSHGIVCGLTENGLSFTICRGGTQSNFGGIYDTTKFENQALPLGQWSHVAFSYNSNKKKIYIDGTLKIYDYSNLTITYDNSRVNLGYNHESVPKNNRGYLDGSLDDIRFYNRALSDEEVVMLYDLEKPKLSLPIISSQPVSSTHPEGSNFNITVVINDFYQNVFIQWFKDGQVLSGKNSATLVINNASSDDSGQYYAIVSAEGKAITTTLANIEITNNISESNLSNALLTASDEGQFETVKRLLAQGANIEAKQDEGWNALHLASRNGHLEIVKLLLAQGTKIEARTNGGGTSLYWASRYGHLEVVEFLVPKGANIEAKTNNGWNPLLAASDGGHLNVVKFILAQGANIEARTNVGSTSLYLASRKGRLEVAKYLLAQGANIEAKKDNRWNPLLTAAYNGQLGTVKLLLSQGANIEAKLDSGETPLYWASRDGHLEVVGILLSKGANIEAKGLYGWNPLHAAAYYGHLDVVKILLAQGANIEVKKEDGWNPLHLASEEAHLDIVKFLLAKGANIEAKQEDGWNPLHLTSEEGHLDVVKFLLAQGANIEAKTNVGATPLYWASHKGELEVIQFLVSKGANIEAKKEGGWNPLLTASDEGHLEIVKFLLEEGANIEAKNSDGWSPLLRAVFSGHIETVETLLNEGANLEARDAPVDATPLVWSVLASGSWLSHNFPADYKFEDHDKIFKLLLSRGANINAADNQGDTAFDNACLHNRPKVIDQLKDYIVFDNLRRTSTGKFRMNIKMIKKGNYKNTSGDIVINIPELKYEVQGSKNFLDWKTIKEIKNTRSLHLFVDIISLTTDTSNYYRVKLAE